MVPLANPIPLPLRDLVPPPERFARESELHGQKHVARVLVHAFALLRLTDSREESRRLWAAVYVHDLARTHDGLCTRHGRDAALLIDRDPALRAHLARGGVAEEDLPAVRAAVTHHCGGELPLDHPHRKLTALLKDADGLDRVRLGDLDPSYFRHPATPSLVPFAEALYGETNDRIPPGAGHFARLWPEALRIWESMNLL